MAFFLVANEFCWVDFEQGKIDFKYLYIKPTAALLLLGFIIYITLFFISRANSMKPAISCYTYKQIYTRLCHYLRGKAERQLTAHRNSSRLATLRTFSLTNFVLAAGSIYPTLLWFHLTEAQANVLRPQSVCVCVFVYIFMAYMCISA